MKKSSRRKIFALRFQINFCFLFVVVVLSNAFASISILMFVLIKFVNVFLHFKNSSFITFPCSSIKTPLKVLSKVLFSVKGREREGRKKIIFTQNHCSIFDFCWYSQDRLSFFTLPTLLSPFSLLLYKTVPISRRHNNKTSSKNHHKSSLETLHFVFSNCCLFSILSYSFFF